MVTKEKALLFPDHWNYKYLTRSVIWHLFVHGTLTFWNFDFFFSYWQIYYPFPFLFLPLKTSHRHNKIWALFSQWSNYHVAE